MYLYKARVDRIIDGDTFEATLDLGFGISTTQVFRVDDLDTPEIFKPKNEAEKQHGLDALKYAEKLLLFPDNKFHLVIKSKKRPQIYGRFSAVITLPNGDDFAEQMISQGFSKKQQY